MPLSKTDWNELFVIKIPKLVPNMSISQLGVLTQKTLDHLYTQHIDIYKK